MDCILSDCSGWSPAWNVLLYKNAIENDIWRKVLLNPIACSTQGVFNIRGTLKNEALHFKWYSTSLVFCVRKPGSG